jgi:hypothetical protein
VARHEGAQLDELAGRDVKGAQRRLVAVQRDVAAHGDGVAPRPLDAAGRDQRRRQPREPLLPLVAPHLQVHVDDVVVGDGHPEEAVVDAERPVLRGGLVVPDDPQALVCLRCPEGAGRTARAELGGGAGTVGRADLEDADLVDRLALAQRDLAEGAAEAAGEGVRDVLVDDEGAVRLHPDDHVGGGQREGTGGRGAGERERGEERRAEP